MFNISVKSVTSHEHSEEWLLRFESFSPQRIMYHPETHEYIEEYIFIHNSPMTNEMQYYEYRKQQNINLVSIISAEIKENVYRVWVEYIPCRLGNINKIDLMTSFIILLNAAKGFKHILELYGEVKIQEDMILINRYGIVKVWLSKYLHYNQPHSEEIQFANMRKGTPEDRMTEDLMHLVLKHLDKETKSELNKIISFSKTFHKMEQSINKYLKTQGIILPERLILKQLDVTEDTQPFIHCLQDVEFNLKQIANNPNSPHLSSLAKKTVSLNSDYPLEKRKRLSSIEIPEDSMHIVKTSTPTAENRISSNSHKFQKNAERKQKRSNTETDHLIDKETEKQENNTIEFDQNKHRLFKSSFKRKMEHINLSKNKLQNTPVKQIPTQENEEQLGKERKLDKLSFSMEAIPKIIINRPQTEQIPQLCFTERSRKSELKFKTKPDVVKQNNSITTRVQTITNTFTQSNIYSYKLINETQQSPNLIECQFNEFLKNSKSRSRVNSSKKKETPCIQFTRLKPTKQKPVPRDRRFQYSNFYEHEVNMRNSRERAYTSRQKNVSEQKMTTYRSIKNFNYRQNSMLMSNGRGVLIRK